MLRPESVRGDFRFDARLLRKNPGFTAVAVLTLALGIGANTAMWSIADAVLLRPLDYPQSERIAVLGEKKECCEFAPTSPANFLDYQRRNRSFIQFAALFPRNFILTRGSGGPIWLRGEVVTPNYFDVLGTLPFLGRTLSPAADRPGRNPQLRTLAARVRCRPRHRRPRPDPERPEMVGLPGRRLEAKAYLGFQYVP